MEKSLIEEYKQKMLNMYKGRVASVNREAVEAKRVQATPEQNPAETEKGATGFLIAIVTAVRYLYFVPGAKVTVFKGTPENMEIIGTAITDQNGRIEPFRLETPAKGLSEDSGNTEPPYALYNLMVEAEGYLTNIHLNIPVFSGVTTRQASNLLLLETAGTDKGPRIFDEMPNYNLQ